MNIVHKIDDFHLYENNSQSMNKNKIKFSSTNRVIGDYMNISVWEIVLTYKILSSITQYLSRVSRELYAQNKTQK